MTRKELEMKLLDMMEEMYKMAKEVDPEIDWISMYAHNGQFDVSAYQDEYVGKTNTSDLFGTYHAYATRFSDGKTWTSEKWSEILGKKEETA